MNQRYMMLNLLSNSSSPYPGFWVRYWALGFCYIPYTFKHSPSVVPVIVPSTLYSMGLRSSATLKGASVLLLISSTVTPSAISISVRPLAKSTSNTP